MSTTQTTQVDGFAPDAAPTPHGATGPRDGRAHSASLWTETMVYARRNIEHIRQIPEKLLDVTVQPLMFVVLFAYVFGGAISVGGGNYREYLIGGILIQSLTFGLVGPATAIATDLNEGVIDRFRSLPSRRSAYLLGHYVAELGGMIMAIVVLLSAGLIVGWRTHADVLHVTEAILLLLVFASAMIWVGTYVGMLVRSPDAVMGIAFVMVFPLTFLSNAFVPINTLPNVLQWIASVNPVSVVVAAVRTLFGNPLSPIAKDIWPMEHPVAAAWLYSLGVLAIAVPMALRRYKVRTTD